MISLGNSSDSLDLESGIVGRRNLTFKFNDEFSVSNGEKRFDSSLDGSLDGSLKDSIRYSETHLGDAQGDALSALQRTEFGELVARTGAVQTKRERQTSGFERYPLQVRLQNDLPKRKRSAGEL